MAVPPQLASDLNDLQERQGLHSRPQCNGNQVLVVIDNYPLPEGWSQKTTTLLLITDIAYPNSKMDMFWTKPDVLLKGGGVPQAGDSIQTFLGEQWRRFSWHVSKWNPAVDNIVTYLDTVNERLRQRQ